MGQVEQSLRLSLLLPELALFALVLILTGTFVLRLKISHQLAGYLVMLGVLITGVLVVMTRLGSPDGNLLVNDAGSRFFKLLFLVATFLAVAMDMSFHKNVSKPSISKYSLLMLVLLAMMFLSMSASLLSIYLFLELCTISLIMLASHQFDSNLATKVPQKFLVISVLSSLLILFGFSFLYGLSGAADLIMMKLQIAVVHITQRQIGVIILLAIAAILSGLMLRGGMIPFNAWMHDLHKNLPIPTVALIATALVSAVLLAFAKIFINGLFAFYGPEMNPNDWGRLVAFVAFINIVFGTVQMLRQKDIMSMLFFSNIVQVGFILTGMISMNQHGLQSAGFYLFSVMFSLAGIYAVIGLVRQSTNSTNLGDFKGLSKSSMPLAILTTVYLMSLAGLPILAGFVAKFSVIDAALETAAVDKLYHWMYLLAGAGIVCAAIMLFKFVKFSIALFGRTEKSPLPIQFPAPLIAVFAITALATLFFGIFPDALLSLASQIPQAFGFIIE